MSEQAPCPDKILDDCGSAFCMGAVGGAVWHGVKGAVNSPRGERIRGGFQSLTLRAPSLSVGFGMWGGLFSVFDCSLQHIRGQDDFINAIGAGACTSGLLAARAGLKMASKQFVVGGVLLGLIEGMGHLMQTHLAAGNSEPQGLLALPTNADMRVRRPESLDLRASALPKTSQGLVRPASEKEQGKLSLDEKTAAVVQQGLFGSDDFKFHLGDDMEDNRW